MNDIAKLWKDLTRKWNLTKKALTNWDIQALEQLRSNYGPQISAFADAWTEYESELAGQAKEMRRVIASPEYVKDLQKALKAAEIPLQGDFPEYEMPPFQLKIDLEACEARLIYGRKQQRTTMLRVESLTQWIAAQYKKIAGKKFDGTRVKKDLLASYQYANRFAYAEKRVEWGRPVELKEIHRLLTVGREAKRDYPESVFRYELAQLKESGDLGLDDYRLELGFERNARNALVLIDSKGRETRVSTLTVHRESKSP